MSRLRIEILVVLILAGGAFLTGYLPERSRRQSAERQTEALRMQADQEVKTVREQLGMAEARVQLGELLGEVLTLKEVAMRQDYGQARELSSRLFDRVRGEAGSTSIASARDALGAVLMQRDTVTAALAKADPGVVTILHGLEIEMRRSLGFVLPPEAAQVTGNP